MSKLSPRTVCEVLLVVALFSASAAGFEGSPRLTVRQHADTGDGLHWHTDYLRAMDAGKQEQKMLLIFFHREETDPARQAFERHSLADPEVVEGLHKFVLAKVPISAKINLKKEDAEGEQIEEEIELLAHPAFEHMHRRQGIAIIDFEHEEAEYYGRLVSAFPFEDRMYYSPRAMRTILSLPPGTLTQRTMIYAVRTHPEAPKSTQGKLSSVLLSQAESHSAYQSRIRVQGHHRWGSRFHEINGQLKGNLAAREVVAESWPGETLVQAAKECVRSWRHSSGHWSAVRGFHQLFGYDIKRGSNGVWYATGIFADE